jgi:hypothetical protein
MMLQNTCFLCDRTQNVVQPCDRTQNVVQPCDKDEDNQDTVGEGINGYKLYPPSLQSVCVRRKTHDQKLVNIAEGSMEMLLHFVCSCNPTSLRFLETVYRQEVMNLHNRKHIIKVPYEHYPLRYEHLLLIYYLTDKLIVVQPQLHYAVRNRPPATHRHQTQLN